MYMYSQKMLELDIELEKLRDRQQFLYYDLGSYLSKDGTKKSDKYAKKCIKEIKILEEKIEIVEDLCDEEIERIQNE